MSSHGLEIKNGQGYYNTGNFTKIEKYTAAYIIISIYIWL